MMNSVGHAKMRCVVHVSQYLALQFIEPTLQFTYCHYRYSDMELEIKVHYKLGACTIIGAASLYVREQLNCLPWTQRSP